MEDVQSFTYIGVIITTSRGANEDIRRRLGLARSTYNKLSPLWNNSQISKSTKFLLFNSNVLSVLLYGSETWKMTKHDEHLVDTFLHKSINRILNIYWPQKMTNEEVRRRAGIEAINTQIKRRRWKWLGHVLRMENTRYVKNNNHMDTRWKRKRRRTQRGSMEKFNRERETRPRVPIMD